MTIVREARRVVRIVRDTRGATIIEFAVVAPVMILLIMGLSDLAYQGYIMSILDGAMQKAGRDSTIQGNDTTPSGAAIDQKVMASVWLVMKSATYVSSRKSYSQFGNIAPESFRDDNGNKVYDAATECFTDVNGNKTWDADPGASGQGGASDVVVYKMTITYPRLFPMAGLAGLSQTVTNSSTTYLKNQPYAGQVSYTPTLVCP
ncbi:TadE/TadG family type IV pilus assembly protein [Sphingomonas sp. PWP1-2]|uniref:TadE/TadG family type IV pilus assembly protein n=1 Tax=Sphingomonas sp. PWP1-2 TaxID=2804558 RepID=UPI003CF5DE58